MHGYVYEDEYAHGIYFLEWCDGKHPHRGAWLTVGLGAFGDGTDATDRNAFCIEWRTEGMRLRAFAGISWTVLGMGGRA